MLLLLTGVGFLFLLAAANIANLLIVHALGRRRELAIRSALGATRPQVIGVVLRDGIALVSIGSITGAIVAALVLPNLVVPARLIAPRNMYGSLGPFADPTVDGRFVALAFGVGILAAFLCAAVPAFLPQSVDTARDLKDGAPSATLGASPRRLTMRSAMIVVETALALMLLVAAGLMAESYRRLRAAPLGFEPSGMLTFWIRPSEVTYPPARAPQLIERVLAEIERVPGVVAASVDGCTPASTGCANSTLYVIGRPTPRPEMAPPVLRHYVAPEHFATLGVPLLRGRTFDASDRAGTKRVAIINRIAAERFFPGEDPIGKRVWFGGGSNFDRPDSAAEIVGIVGDVAYQPLDERPMQPDFYTPYLQFTYASRAVLVRTTGIPASLVPAMRAAVRRTDPGLALYEVRTMDEKLSESAAGRRFDTTLLAAFGIIALLLAAMGIFAIVAHSVAQRTREMGIRLALGARPEMIVGLVVREGMIMPGVGLVAGVAGALALTRVIRSALYGVSATNPAVYTALIALFTGLAALACYLPARRASRVDPVVALHH
jgi:predicted permease